MSERNKPQNPESGGGQGRNPQGSPGQSGDDIFRDSPSDQERLKQDVSSLELPEIREIPGQKTGRVDYPEEMGDTTASSDDEEGIRDGKDIMDNDDVKIVMGTEADVTKEDLILLGAMDQDQDGGDDELLPIDILDTSDEDGDPLNEALSPDDLDIPGDTDEEVEETPGMEDEENEYYSLGSDNNDDIVEGTP